jgi:hypothetical protein
MSTTSSVTGEERRSGINPLQFSFNQRALGHPPLEKGPLAGVIIDDNVMLQDFLRAMDWDQTTTKPSINNLCEIGLNDMVF